MNLKNRQITLGELWDDPRSRAVFQKKVPVLGRHPIRGAARSVTLEQLTDLLSGWVPEGVLSGVVQELNRV